MEKHESGPDYFSPSGCLTREGMQAVVTGNLDSSMREQVEKHLSECEFCRLAMEGTLSFVEDHGTAAWEQDLASADSLAGVLVPGAPPETVSVSGKRRHNVIWTSVAVAATIVLFLGLAYVIRLWLPIQPEQLAQQTPPQEAVEIPPPVMEDRQEPAEARPAEQEAPGPGPAAATTAGIREHRIPVEASEQETPIPDTVALTTDPLLFHNITASQAPQASASYGGFQNTGSGTAMNTVQPDQVVITSESKSVSQEHIKAVSVMEKKALKEEQLSQDDAPAVFYLVEEMPSFPGGQDSLQAFLNRNIRYPLQAREAKLSGTVQLSFVIDRKGRIRDITVLKGIGMACDEEAIRVVKNMPRWHPGKQAGKTVDVRFTLPVRFEL